jgi:hypothetical protein
MIEKVLLWMTAPEAYHHGPLTPNRYLCNEKWFCIDKVDIRSSTGL